MMRSLILNLSFRYPVHVKRSVGRPPNRRDFDEDTMRVARRALEDGAKALGLPRGRYPDSNDPGRLRTRTRPLDTAVLAITLSQALEVVASEQVQLARKIDGSTWEEVGEAFDISMQSAHARFRVRH